MKPTELGSMWLRDKARALRIDAKRCAKAYSSGQLAEVCTRVATAYSDAARWLDDEADRLERTGIQLQDPHESAEFSDAADRR